MAYINQTRATDRDPVAFLHGIENPVRKADGFRLLALMRRITGKPAVMWGRTLVGFGSFRYLSRSDQRGDFLMTGFSPRKSGLSIYVLSGFDEYHDFLAQLGRHTTGRSCLHIEKLADIDEVVLVQLITTACEDMERNYICS